MFLGLILAASLPVGALAYVIPPEPLLDLGVGAGGGVEALTGAWTGLVGWRGTGSSATIDIQLSLRQGRRPGESHHTVGCPVGELRNLLPEQVTGSARDVTFELRRDAGVLRFAGRFHAAEGTGNFSFQPSADYLLGMRALGYPAIDAEKAYGLAVLDVSRRFVQDLRAVGRSGLTLEQLITLRTHGVDAAYVRTMTTLGYGYLSADRLVTFKIHGVSPEFVTAMRAVGYATLRAGDLVSFRANGVSADFVRELQALGYRRVPAADLVTLRVQGVSPDFVRRVNANARATVSVTRLLALRASGRL